MARDIESLVLTMSADIRRMEKSLAQGQRSFDRTADAIERRQRELERNLASLGSQMGNFARPVQLAATVALGAITAMSYQAARRAEAVNGAFEQVFRDMPAEALKATAAISNEFGRLTVRDLLSQGRMDGSTLEYVKETGFNNNAAPVAEAAAKPESDLQFDLVTTSAKVIAHWMKASRQILSDVSQLRSTIDQRLLYGLSYVEEQQLLNGSGTGQNLHGIIPQATAYAAPITIAGATSIDMMRLAMLQAALAEYPATGHVMNPIDWAFIETLKDSDGRYIIGNPQGSIAPTLWGLPVVTTQAIAVDKFLTGAFKLGAQVFDRWDARVETGYVNDDFTKNLVTILAEERLALAVYRPEAFIYGDFGRVT